MPVDLTIDIARRIVNEHAAANGIAVVYPEDYERSIYRVALVTCLATLRAAQSHPVHLDALLMNESCAVPGVMPAAASALEAVLHSIPVAGPVLAEIFRGEDRLYFAPAACKDGATLIATAARLLSYATTWQRGVGVAFAAAWLAIGEERAGVGSQAVIQGAQVRLVLGASVAEAMAEARAHVATLDLDATDRTLADRALVVGEASLDECVATRKAMLGGPSLTLLRALRDAGVSLALDVA